VLKHASRSRHIDPDRPPAAAGGLRGPRFQTSFMALGSCSTAASCSRLVDENGPASSTEGRGQASTWQLQLSHWAVRASTDEQRTGYARGVAIVQTAQRRSHDVYAALRPLTGAAKYACGAHEHVDAKIESGVLLRVVHRKVRRVADR
jgi:hypothetical protein